MFLLLARQQDSIDLFLGNYIVDSNEGITKASPLVVTRDWRFMTVSAPCVHSMLRFETGNHGAGSGGTWDKRLKFIFMARNSN